MKKKFCLLLALSLLAISLFSSAYAAKHSPGVIDLENKVYAKVIGETYTRTGPGTEYKGKGGFNLKGQFVQLISYANDINNRCWVQIAIPTTKGYRYSYINSSQIDDSTYDKADVFSEMELSLNCPATIIAECPARYAPAEYCDIHEEITMEVGDEVKVIAVAGDFAFVDFAKYTQTTGKQQYRCWVPLRCLSEFSSDLVSTENTVDSQKTVAMATFSDTSFLNDMSAGLAARWALSDQDPTIMSNKQFAAHTTTLIDSELDYIAKYSDYPFEDQILGRYAHAYINALNMQMNSVTEYVGTDENLFNRYWTAGEEERALYLYLINKEYGLTIPSEHNELFSETAKLGRLRSYVVPMEAAISAECYSLEPLFDTSSSYSLDIKPFDFTNRSPYDIIDLTIQMNLLDKNNKVVERTFLILSKNILAGETISTEKAYIYEPFVSVTYTYSFGIETEDFYKYCEGTVTPAKQYSWAGSLTNYGID